MTPIIANNGINIAKIARALAYIPFTWKAKKGTFDITMDLIKEVRRDKKISNTQSFSAEKIDYITFTPPELVHDKIEIQDESDMEE